MKDNIPIIGICRHRLQTDGDGVTTLVAFHGCPLHCQYCLNPQCWDKEENYEKYDCNKLYETTKIDELYFLATQGGITFGGGEPCLQSEFIYNFRKVCGESWLLNVETSLNVPMRHIERLLSVIDCYFIDIKDMNPDIYYNYTGNNNKYVLRNLRLLIDNHLSDKIIIRIPLIPDYNTNEDRQRSIEQLKEMGFTKFDLFTYRTFNSELS